VELEHSSWAAFDKLHPDADVLDMVLVNADLPVRVDPEDVARHKTKRDQAIDETVYDGLISQVDDFPAKSEDAIQKSSHVAGLLGFEEVKNPLQEGYHLLFATGALDNTEHPVQVPQKVILQVCHAGKTQQVEKVIDSIESRLLFVHAASESIGYP